MISKFVWCMSLVMFLGQPLAVLAEATEEDARNLIASAVSYATTNGVAKLESEITAKSPEFVKGDLYAYTMNVETGRISAHPTNPKLVGQDLLEVPDPDGKLFRKEIIEKAKTVGSGSVDYKYLNPTTKKLSPR